MPGFSFIHAADLHLDSPFCGVTAESEAIATAIRRSTFDAFDNLIAAAIARRVDFVVIAGDVYDGSDRSLRAQLRFRDGLARLARAGIRSFVVHGNHDALDGWSATIAWPDGVRIFGDTVETEVVEIGGAPAATVSGVSFAHKVENRNLVRMFPRPAGGLFHVGLVHANVGANTGHAPYAPAELADFRESGYDYWALGHVHARAVLAEHPHVVYPGNLQARHVREPGARGCMLVCVDDSGGVTTEFLPLDVIRFSIVTVDASAIETIDALSDRVLGAVEEAAAAEDGRALICRVSIGGRTALSHALARKDADRELLERLREQVAGVEPFVWVEALDVAVRPEIDLDERRQGEDLLAEVLTIAAEVRAGPDGLARVRDALAELYRNPRAARALDELTDEEVAALVAEAEMLCVDRLEGAS